MPENKQLWIILKKTEKLTTAIYMLTDFFDDKESLKWELRGSGVSFLSFINSLAHDRGVQGGSVRAGGLLQRIFTLLTLGRDARLISMMNFSILYEDSRTVRGALEREIAERGSISDFDFPERFFSDETGRRPALAVGGPSSAATALNEGGFPAEGPIKDKKENSNFSLQTNDYNGDNPPVYRKDFSRQVIIRMLRAKGEITIKDIAHHLKGVSGKTLQRELISLMNEGVISREGKKRWSKYLLKT